jgi:hypothetical protein
MEYKDSNPENQQFVVEIQRMTHFNNLHGHFPNQFYRRTYEYAKKMGLLEVVERMEKNRLPLWQSIDEFIKDTSFDIGAYWADLSQIRLCPMYIFLRKKGFSPTDLTQ